VPALAQAITRLPAALSAALLAGVLLPLCLAPARAVAELPELAGPVTLVWLVLLLVARSWAVPGSVVAAVIVLVADGSAPPFSSELLPVVDLTAPVFRLDAILGIALPLFVVTMASQNVTGAAVLQAFGYRPDVSQALTVTGVASAAAAPLGGHGVNLAAITAAITAGPEAGTDPARRWIASSAAGVAAIALGALSGAAAALLLAAPPLLVQAVAGLALLGALGGALAAAMDDPDEREAAIVTLVVSAGGFSALGITAPFWGLLAGLAFRALRRSVPSG
jgi:benzoate membrane transport protein